MPCRRRFVRERRHRLDERFAGLVAWEREGLHSGRLCFAAGSSIISRNRNYPMDALPGCVGRREFVEWLAKWNGAL